MSDAEKPAFAWRADEPSDEELEAIAAQERASVNASDEYDPHEFICAGTRIRCGSRKDAEQMRVNLCVPDAVIYRVADEPSDIVDEIARRYGVDVLPGIDEPREDTSMEYVREPIFYARCRSAEEMTVTEAILAEVARQENAGEEFSDSGPPVSEMNQYDTDVWAAATFIRSAMRARGE